MNNKKKYLVMSWISLILMFTFLTFFVIGIHSDYLVKNIFKNMALIFMIISFICLIYSIIKLIKLKRRKGFKKVFIFVVLGISLVYAIGCISFLGLLYGPYKGFKDWLITTAMATMSHQYYCKWFYSIDDINYVLNSNTITDLGEDTDTSLIDHEISTTYKDEYDKAVLEHEDGQTYKIINFEVNGQKAYLAVIYDASKISVGISKWLGRSGQYIYDMAKEQGAVLAINGGGFQDPNYNSNGANPIGVTIANGKIITDYNMGNSSVYGVIGFNQDNTLVLLQNINADSAVKAGVRDAVTMGPFLIVNGKKSITQGNGGWGYAARTAIGQRKDGIVLLLVVDSNATRTKGASMKDLVDIMARYGAINAANLDGGTSSVMVEKGLMINDPIDSALRHRTRGIPTIFKVIE